MKINLVTATFSNGPATSPVLVESFIVGLKDDNLQIYDQSNKHYNVR